MSDSMSVTGTQGSVIAIAQVEGTIKAVELAKRGEGFELLWARSSSGSGSDFGSFAGKWGLSGGAATRADGSGCEAVVGFDSAAVVFYRLKVPVVKEQEFAAIVRLQSEARLPLAAEQMELGWRKVRAANGQADVTVAAARTVALERFVEEMRGFEPARIILSNEGLVKAWRLFYCGTDKAAVIVSIGGRSTQVCLAEDGKLVNAVSLDIGVEDFSFAEGGDEQSGTAGRLAQDVQGVLELFGYADTSAAPVFVLSDGAGAIASIVSSLRAEGLNAQAVSPDFGRLAAQQEFGAQEAYEYRVPVGLAAMMLDGETDVLNVFGRVYKPAREIKAKRWFYSPALAGVVAAVMLALFVIVSYGLAARNERYLSGLMKNADFRQFVERQRLIKEVARERPDLLELLKEVNLATSAGIMLHSFEFRKGQPVRVSGEAGNDEQLFKFQESLLSKKGISEPQIQNAAPAKEGGKITFTVSFHYKNFTKKKEASARLY